MNGQDKLRADLSQRTAAVAALYFILRLIVTGLLLYSLLRRRYEHAFLCALSLVLFLMPSVLERRLCVALPNPLEVLILLFIFAAQILGELGRCYLQYPHWDTMLHITSGFLTAAVGFTMIDLLNRSSRVSLCLSPLFCAAGAFCFSMTIGVLWEFFEFAMDVVFHTDMQKDTILQAISSTYLDPAASNTPIRITGITNMALNGRCLTVGYLDIGLYDTMEDLLINFLGASVFSFIGYRHRSHKGSSRLAQWFIPTVQRNNETDA